MMKSRQLNWIVLLVSFGSYSGKQIPKEYCNHVMISSKPLEEPIPLPLDKDNPLILANDEYQEHITSLSKLAII